MNTKRGLMSRRASTHSALSLLPGLSNGPKPTDLNYQGSIYIFKQYSLLGFRFPSFIVVALPQL